MKVLTPVAQTVSRPVFRDAPQPEDANKAAALGLFLLGVHVLLELEILLDGWVFRAVAAGGRL